MELQKLNNFQNGDSKPFVPHSQAVKPGGKIDIELERLNRNDNFQNGDSKPFVPSSQVMMPGRYKASRFGAYRPTLSDKIIFATVCLFNVALFLLALGALFVGIFLNTYRGSYADLCSDNEWFVAAGCMLAVGSLLLIFLVICSVAMCKRSSRLLTAYIVFIGFLICGELAAGIYAFARRSYIESRFQACMKDSYQNDYQDPSKEHVTKAWDLFQERFDCCGVDDPFDYRSNKKHPDRPPKSCGGERGAELGRKPCFEVIKREVLDNFYIIGGSAIGIAGIQIIDLIFCCLLLRIFYKREEFE